MCRLSCRVPCWVCWLTGLLGLLLLSTAPVAADDVEAGFKPIFNGKTLEGWDGNPKFWRVEDGAITGETTKENPTNGNTFIIWRQGELDDFELKLKFRIVGGNSGIQFRSKEPSQWVIAGYQADFDAAGGWTGTLYEERGRGVLAKRGSKVVISSEGKPQATGETTPEKTIVESIKKEDWNDYHIIAQGNHLVLKVNGLVTADVTDNDANRRALSGLLALQLHAGPPMKVQFKDIRLKRLKLSDNRKKVVFLAGRPSHGYGSHEHRAGSLILARAINEGMQGKVLATVYTNGWPADPTALDNADGIVIYCDGAGGHVVNPHLEELDALMKKGVGLACIHFAVEVVKGPPGEAFLSWLGGYFEVNWSVNPHWTADYAKLPDHPITRGVKPFKINDEWYYHMRFRPDMEGVVPILSATPPDSTRGDGKNTSSRGGNPAVFARRGLPEITAWATERPEGGRGFGFTGGHVHWNWGHDQFRKLVCNAVCWIAQAEVPADGVPVSPLSVEDLMANQDEPVPDNFDKARIQQLLDEWHK